MGIRSLGTLGLTSARVKVPAALLLALVALGIPTPAPSPPQAVWDVLAVIVRRTELEVPGVREPIRIRLDTAPADRERIARELGAFARRLEAGSGGRLVARIRTIAVDGPLATLSGPGPYWIGPADAAPLLPEGAAADADLVMVFGKIGDDAGPAAPVRHFGGALGGDQGPDGACFAGIGYRPSWIRGDGDVALHEFLHGLDWALAEIAGFPDGAFPDPDEGRLSPNCCPDAPAGDGAFADHLLARHLAPEMAAAADARRGPAVEDGFLRGWTVDGRSLPGAWRTITLAPHEGAARAELAADVAEIALAGNGPLLVRIGTGPPVRVAPPATLPASGPAIEIRPAAPGAAVRFAVRISRPDSDATLARTAPAE